MCPIMKVLSSRDSWGIVRRSHQLFSTHTATWSSLAPKITRYNKLIPLLLLLGGSWQFWYFYLSKKKGTLLGPRIWLVRQHPVGTSRWGHVRRSQWQRHTFAHRLQGQLQPHLGSAHGTIVYLFWIRLKVLCLCSSRQSNDFGDTKIRPRTLSGVILASSRWLLVARR